MQTKTFEVQSACITSCTIATNCPQGGDGGHGGVTILELKDEGGTSFGVEYEDTDLVVALNVRSVKLSFYGDAEARNLCELLKSAASALEDMLKENKANRS